MRVRNGDATKVSASRRRVGRCNLRRTGRACRTGVPQPAELPQPPNIIVLMTDQERYHTHWPAGWVEANLPAFVRLQRHGLTFHRAYTAASECSPSRAVMMTGEFAPMNRVARTFLWPGLPRARQRANIGSLLGIMPAITWCGRASGT